MDTDAHGSKPIAVGVDSLCSVNLRFDRLNPPVVFYPLP
jgi:hypothetical protein